MSTSPVVAAGRERYHLVKAFLYVTPLAPLRTTITLAAPPGALLYYTDAATWAARPSDAQIMAGTSTAVTVESCSGALAGYTGGLLLRQPTCVTLRIGNPGDAAAAQAVDVPIGVAVC